MSRGTRARTDQIDAELIARFMMFRPEAGRMLPGENLRFLRTLTTRRAQIVEMRKRLSAQISARRKQGIAANIEDLDDALKAMLDAQISDLEQRVERTIANEQTPRHQSPASSFHSGHRPGLRSQAGCRRAIAGGRRVLRQVLFQAALAAACHNPALKPLAKRLKERGKRHKLVIIAIARRLITIANAILKTGGT